MSLDIPNKWSAWQNMWLKSAEVCTI